MAYFFNSLYKPKCGLRRGFNVSTQYIFETSQDIPYTNGIRYTPCNAKNGAYDSIFVIKLPSEIFKLKNDTCLFLFAF